MSGVAWGDVPTWITSISVVAVIGGWFQATAKERRQRLNQERRQAELMTVGFVSPVNTDLKRPPRVTINNPSAAPLYDVYITFSVTAPGQSPQLIEGHSTSVDAGAHKDLDEIESQIIPIPGESGEGWKWSWAASFTDARSHRWRKTSSGELSRAGLVHPAP